MTGANGSLGSSIVHRIVNSPELANHHGIYTHHSSRAVLSKVLAAGVADQPQDILQLDLSSLADVRQTSAAINARVAAGESPPIRAIMLNAGYQDYGKQEWSGEGESRLSTPFAANYLGHWMLCLLLLESMDKEKGRIVVVSSFSHE